MVTHGYVVFKYKGIYYTFYNHSDSYFEHLGNVVVNEIQNMVNKNKVKEYKELLLRIPLKGNEEGEWNVDSFYYLLNHPDTYQYFTTNKEPGNEYTYIIDFDTNKFIANKYGENVYKFNLYDVPLDWYEITQNNSNYNTETEDNNDEDKDKSEEMRKIINDIEESLKKLKKLI